MASTSVDTCPVCAEAYTALRRKPVACGACRYAPCQVCLRRFLTTTHRDACCMNCHVGLDADFLESHLPKAWFQREYRAHRKTILLDRERMLMPATMPTVEAMVAAPNHMRDVEAARKALEDTLEEQRRLERAYNALRYPPRDEDGRAGRNARLPAYTRKCPAEGCRGYVGEKWTCGLCAAKVCEHCHVVVGVEVEDHACNPDDVATAQLMAKDTRACPTCAAPIYKADGCSQVWCPQCRTAFDFYTGAVETNHIHSPDFYRWLRERTEAGEAGAGLPRAAAGVVGEGCPADPLAGYIPDPMSLHLALRGLPLVDEVMAIHRLLRHVRHIEMRRHRPEDAVDANVDLRIRFLSVPQGKPGSLSEQDLAEVLQRRERAREVKAAVFNAVQFLHDVGSELFGRVTRALFDRGAAGEAATSAVLEEVVTEFRGLIGFYGDLTQRVAKRFGARQGMVVDGRTFEFQQGRWTADGKTRRRLQIVDETDSSSDGEEDVVVISDSDDDVDGMDE